MQDQLASLTRDEEPTRLLHSIADMTGERNFDDIRLSLVRTVSELLPARAMTFYKISPTEDGPRLNEVLRVRRGTGGMTDATGLGPRGVEPSSWQLRAVQSGQPLTHVSADRRLECVPIMFRQRVIELIVTEFGRDGDEGVMLRAMLRLYANIIDLIYDKEMDSLTGVLNRRAFDSHLDGLVRQPYQLHSLHTDTDAENWWLVMIDADHFKQINDSFGHLIGDEVLILLARLMQQHFRAIDSIYRYGGEEFAVVLAPSTRADAVGAIERLREVVAGHAFPQVGQVTISAGMVVLDRFDHISSMIGQADRALYFAKQHGRNQVCEYHELVAAGLLAETTTSNEVELF